MLTSDGGDEMLIIACTNEETDRRGEVNVIFTGY